MVKHTFKCCLDEVSTAVQWADEELKLLGAKTEYRTKAILSLEETLVKVISLKAPDDRFSLTIKKNFRRTSISIRYCGQEISLGSDIMSIDEMSNLEDAYGPEGEAMIRDIVLQSNANNIRQRHSKGITNISITVSRSSKVMLYYMLGAMLFGVLCGVIVRYTFAPDIQDAINNNLFTPLYSIFISAIKMVVAPLVFFSIISSISGFTDVNSIGRTGMKIFTCYSITSILALLLSYCFVNLFHIGEGVAINLPTGNGDAVNDVNISLIDTITGIIPDNFFGSFVASDMLQVIFLALLFGISIGKLGKHAHTIKSCTDALNELFGMVTTVISSFLPFAIFGSMASMALTLDINTIGIVASWFGTAIVTMLTIFIIYNIMFIVSGLNPLHFIKKYTQVMLTGLLTSSSSATMPTSLKCCKRLGVSPKIYTFSIPLGATINMDGYAIMLAVTTLFTANLYGINLEGMTLGTLMFTAFLLTMAAPGVPGGGNVCVLMLFSIAGIPSSAFSIVLGILPLLELFATSLNVTGDGVVTTVVAHSENELDLKEYKK